MNGASNGDKDALRLKSSAAHSGCVVALQRAYAAHSGHAPTPASPSNSPTPAVTPKPTPVPGAPPTPPPAPAPTPTPVPGSTLSPEAIDVLCAQALGSCSQCHASHPECIWCTVSGGGACLRQNSTYGQLCPAIGVPFRQGQACPAPNPCTAAHGQACTACLAAGQSMTCGYCKAFGSGICVGAGSGTLTGLVCTQANGTFLSASTDVTSCPTSLSFTTGTQAPTTTSTT